MTAVAPTDMTDLITARHLLELARKSDARRAGKVVEEKSALDYLEEDQAFISAAAIEASQQQGASMPAIENIDVKLSDLKHPAAPETEFTFVQTQSVEVRLELRYLSADPIEGLVVHDQNYAESDRYLFKFTDGSSFTILDKWTNKSTTVWGDPHVDLNDMEGNLNGDFKDLTASDDFTTFMLSDGSRLTFKAKDAGIIEQVDIFKGNQRVHGVGQAAEGYSAESGLFFNQTLNDGEAVASATQLGDVVYAGGDGNDWFDAHDKLVWGKTTAPVITRRPSATLEFYYRSSVSQSLLMK